MSVLDISKIKQVPLNKGEFLTTLVKKVQATVHHTAGGPSGVNTVGGWNKDKRGPIATPFTISGPGARNSYDGEIIQAFSSKYWAYHLGVKTEVFKARGLKWKNLDALAIGIEICNWGGLDYENGKFLNYVDGVVNPKDVITLDQPFKGYTHFHKYSDAQIESLRQLLVYLGETYGIDLTYSYDQMFKVSEKALKGENGLFTHNSYRKDKIDIYPCPRMIAMFETLTK